MNPIFVAIDTSSLVHALEISEAVRDFAGGVKLGLEFFSAQGPQGVSRIADLALPIFLDVKLHDIPNTIAKAVEALAPLKPAILTVHAAGGHEMLLAAKRAAPPETKVVAVTLLTSLDEGDLLDLGAEQGVVEKSGSWYSFGGERIGQGRENARVFLKEHAEVREKIDGQLRKKLGLIEEKSASA